MAYISAAQSIRVSSTIFTQSAQKATEFGEITQPIWAYYAVQGMYVCMYIRLKQLTNRNIDNTEINVRVNDSSKQLI